MPRLHFVQELPVGSTKKDKELERAKARAHSASVSYQSHHPERPEPPPKPDRLRRARKTSNVGRDVIKQSTNAQSKLGFISYDGASSSNLQQHGIDTPPDSPGRYESHPASLDAVASGAQSDELTPPDSSFTESIIGDADADAEHVEDISIDNDYSLPHSSTSNALIQHTRRRASHQIYQINPHAQYTDTSQSMPWSTSTTNIELDFIPHDLLGTRADPFDCIPHRHAHSASVNAVTDYHAQIMAPNHAPIYKIFNVTNVYTSYYFELLTHPDFLYTGVASVQAIIDHLRRRPDEPVGPSEQVMKHIGTAMGRLRKRLGRLQKAARETEHQRSQTQASDTDTMCQEPNLTGTSAPSSENTLIVDDMTIMTVLFLAVVTRAINDLPSHEIHKRTISSLVSARGGLQNMTGHDGLARCTLMQWESFWALNTGVTIFPEARPPYSPVYPSTPIVQGSEMSRKIRSLAGWISGVGSSGPSRAGCHRSAVSYGPGAYRPSCARQHRHAQRRLPHETT